MMFSAETKKMDMNVISLADTILHPAAKGAFAVHFLFDFEAMKRWFLYIAFIFTVLWIKKGRIKNAETQRRFGTQRNV